MPRNRPLSLRCQRRLLLLQPCSEGRERPPASLQERRGPEQLRLGLKLGLGLGPNSPPESGTGGTARAPHAAALASLELLPGWSPQMPCVVPAAASSKFG